MMDKFGNSSETVERICGLLPDDRVVATSEIMSAAALVALTWGFDDETAVHALRVALRRLRERGLGEGRH